jgi:hypothetical protein
MIRRWQNLRETTVAHAPWELLLMRAAFAWLLWRLLPASVPFTAQPFPTGVARLADLTFLADAGTYAALRAGAGAGLALYALGVAPVLTLLWPAALLTACGALENSQGATGHHLQLPCLVALGQWCVYAADAVRGQGGARSAKCGLLPATDAQRRAAQAAKLVLAAGYFASGCVKLIASRGLWFWQVADIPVQFVKAAANEHYDTLAPLPEWLTRDLPALMAAHPNLTRLAFAPGLLLELAALLALTGRRAALAVGLGLLAMHGLVDVFMRISFASHEWLLAIWFVNAPWLVAAAWTRWRGGGGGKIAAG